MTHNRPQFKLLLLTLLLLCFGCNNHTPAPIVNVTPSALVSPQDFALDTVVGLLRNGVTDGQSLENRINDPSTGINNIDLDKDGKVDYVQVQEAAWSTGRKMDLVAHPSSNVGSDTPVAGIKFNQAGPGVDVQASYTQQIDPTGQYYYHDTLGSDLAFAAWLFMPARPIYYAPIPVGYAYRSRVPVTTFTQTRTTYTTQTKVAPVRTQPMPPTYNQARVTTPSAPRSAATTVTGASQGVSGFQVDNRTKAAGTGFGGSSRPTTSSPISAPVSRPSTTTSRPSSPSLSTGRKR